MMSWMSTVSEMALLSLRTIYMLEALHLLCRTYWRRIDSFHTVFELLHPNGFLCLASAHQSACTVGSWIVPVRITFTNAYQWTVAHVQRNDQGLTGFCTDWTFSQYHSFKIYIVMDGIELGTCFERHLTDNRVGHGTSVQRRILLGRSPCHEDTPSCLRLPDVPTLRWFAASGAF